MPKPITKIVPEVMPAVVSIIISKHLKEIEKEIPHDLIPLFPSEYQKQLNTLRHLADINGMIQIGGGSGFIVDESGIIITNRHVIADPQAEYTIITTSDQEFGAEVIARDPVSDVAILRLHANEKTKGKVSKLPTLTLGDSSKVKLGESILAIGNSLGIFRNTVSAGIISGLSRSIQAQIDPKSPVQEIRGLIQTDAAINPGNSGGPLLNLSGQVIGINAAIVFNAENIGFAIPINTAKRDLFDLKKHGHLKRPLLGIRYVTIDENLKAKLNLSTDHGAIIVAEDFSTPGVIPGTPAARAGLKEKDIIISCDGEPLSTTKTIQDFLEDKSAGDQIKLEILRDGHHKIINLTLSERK
jgi:serine protease Do